MQKLSTHYSQRALAVITGESPRTLRWWRSMGWLQPTKRTPCYERFTLEAYSKACAASALHAPELPERDFAPKKTGALKPNPEFFTQLYRELGISKPTKK